MCGTGNDRMEKALLMPIRKAITSKSKLIDVNLRNIKVCYTILTPRAKRNVTPLNRLKKYLIYRGTTGRGNLDSGATRRVTDGWGLSGMVLNIPSCGGESGIAATSFADRRLGRTKIATLFKTSFNIQFQKPG